MIKEWIYLGEYPGQKTEDLKQLSNLKPKGLIVVPGISMGASYFTDFVATHTNQGKIRSPYGEEISPLLRLANEQALLLLKQHEWIAVRSSATDEKGGTGIYDSSFMKVSGTRGEDLSSLEEIEKRIYWSYFTKDALLYQRQRDVMGMGLLIQSVVGSRFGKHFAPAISGVCTFDNGTPIMRAVIGLGTKAVRPDEALIYDTPDINLATIKRGLKDLRFMDAFNDREGLCYSNITISDSFRTAALREAPKLHRLFSNWQNYYQEGKPFYWEFAIDPSYHLPCIVQSTLEEPCIPIPTEMSDPEGKVIGESDDVVNMGVKKGRGVFVLGDTSDFDTLAEWDKSHPGCLIVIKDQMLTTDLPPICRISFRHFSNAAAIVEQVIEGIHYRSAGSHFSEICRRKDILFLSILADREDLVFQELLGAPTEKVGQHSFYWDSRFKVTNTSKQGRVEILEG